MASDEIATDDSDQATLRANKIAPESAGTISVQMQWDGALVEATVDEDNLLGFAHEVISLYDDQVLISEEGLSDLRDHANDVLNRDQGTGKEQSGEGSAER